jgi:hypothetical protein
MRHFEAFSSSAINGIIILGTRNNDSFFTAFIIVLDIISVLYFPCRKCIYLNFKLHLSGVCYKLPYCP